MKISELAIKRALNETTRKENVRIGGKGYSMHITKNREAIITDILDYTKVYAVISLDLYNAMTDNSANDMREYKDFVARTLAANEPRPFCPFCGLGRIGYCDMVGFASCCECDEAQEAWYKEKEKGTQDEPKD